MPRTAKGTWLSPDCALNGAGICDGHDYESGQDCGCRCHDDHGPVFATYEDARLWHSEDGW